MVLNNALKNKKYRVIEIKLDEKLARRLQELGIVKGGRVHMVRRAPLGDPIHICINGQNISLRDSVCSGIVIEEDK